MIMMKRSHSGNDLSAFRLSAKKTSWQSCQDVFCFRKDHSIGII